MDNISWKSWAFQACAHIRFKPDRAAVEEELLAHLEDKAEAILREKELTVYEAERQALASMGDADEVGRAAGGGVSPLAGLSVAVVPAGADRMRRGGDLGGMGVFGADGLWGERPALVAGISRL